MGWYLKVPGEAGISPFFIGLQALGSHVPNSTIHPSILFTYAALPLEAKFCLFFLLDKCLNFVYMLGK